MNTLLMDEPVVTAPKKRKTSLKIDPAEAAEKLQRNFRRVARKFVRRDVHLRRDVVQEMSLAVLSCKRRHTLAWFSKHGYWRAFDYVRRIIDRPERLVANITRHQDRLIGDRVTQHQESLQLAEG